VLALEPASLKTFFGRRFTTRGDGPAITFLRGGRPETRLSYANLDGESNRAANRLRSLGVGPADPVMLCLPKSLAAVVCHLAILKVGAISVPVNPDFRQGELAYLVGHTGPKLTICGTTQADIIRAIDPALPIWQIDTRVPYQSLGMDRFSAFPIIDEPVAADAPAVILYTSGTTGQPKGAVLTNANLIHDAQNIISTWQIGEDDTICHALPLFHTHGLSFAFHTILGSGGHVVMMDRFDAETALAVLSCKQAPLRCSLFMAVPAMYIKLIETMGEKALALEHLRLLASGSAPLLPKDFQRIRDAFGRIPVEREGMTETGMNFSNPLSGLKKPGSIGQPLPHLQVRIVDPATSSDVISGQAGEIWLKGPGITAGYWRNPEETEKAFADGWFRTGDIGRVDDEGYYFLIDRLKDIIISGGENISPKEVETVINQIDAVQESAVVGVPDEKWGEMVVAAVVLHGDAEVTTETILAHCRSNLHPWKVPKSFRIVDKIAKNRMGKILRKAVQSLFSDPIS
jgi:malonyl-CoA/methylmalonyl-CoA synthetase